MPKKVSLHTKEQWVWMFHILLLEEVKKKKPKGKPRGNPKGRPKGAKNKTKPPRKITLPTGRAMDEAITKIQQQLLIEKDKLKKMNMGGVMKNRGGTFKGVF